MVPFALFSSKLDEDDKSRLAARILSFEKSIPSDYPLVKPVFPTITPTTTLEDLVTEKSFMFFHILNVDWEWLKLSPSNWSDQESFVEVQKFVQSTKVVNDLAERGIKLIGDYAKILTKDEEMRERLLQGVEMNRMKFPDFKKKTLNDAD